VLRLPDGELVLRDRLGGDHTSMRNGKMGILGRCKRASLWCSWSAVQSYFFVACTTLLVTHLLSAQDTKKSKIPEGEAQFSQEQLQQYYRVYESADVRYLRTIFDAYLNKVGGSKEEFDVLDKWDKDYLHSKFIVLSRKQNEFGGTLITLLFLERPDKVFVAWVYPEGSNRELKLRALRLGDFGDEDIKRIAIRYKKLLEDKTHAM